MKLFDKLYDGAKEVIKAMKKPLMINAFTRKFDAFIDGCDAQIDKLESDLFDYQSELDVSKYDLNKVCDFILQIEQAKKVKAIAIAQKDAMFNQEVVEEVTE